MALSDDQKAMLRLLAQGDVSIEDIAALKGMSVEEVRAEVNAALGEAKEPAPEPLEERPAPVAPPPPAEKPATPAKKEAEPVKSAATRKARSAASRPRPGVPVERRRLLMVAGGALGLVAAVLGLIALIDGSGGDSDANGSTVSATGVAAESDKVTQAVLGPPDGGDASGNAIFGRLGQDEVVLQVTAENLEPNAEGESYTVWLYRSPKLSLRVGGATVDEAGRLGVRLPIPAELLAYVAGGAFDQIYVSRTSDAAYQREVARAKQNKSLPRYSGETVLSGEITGPLAEAAANQGG